MQQTKRTGPQRRRDSRRIQAPTFVYQKVCRICLCYVGGVVLLAAVCWLGPQRPRTAHYMAKDVIAAMSGIGFLYLGQRTHRNLRLALLRSHIQRPKSPVKGRSHPEAFKQASCDAPSTKERAFPTRSSFPANTTFHIKEFDVPLAHVPNQGWWNWFGGSPRPYDAAVLSVGNNWPAESFEDWQALIRDSIHS